MPLITKVNGLPALRLQDFDDWFPEHITESAWLEHTPFAAWLVKVLEPKIFVELGTHRAVSYMAFCQANATRTEPGRCFAVDTWQGDEHSGRYNDDIFENVERINQKYASFSSLLRCTFDDALDRFADGTVDLLHIDGFHTYEAVSHDFHSWLPKMSNAGIVLFHDIEVRDKDFGVWRLWNDLCLKYNNFHFIHGYGLGVLAVGDGLPSTISKLLNPSLEDMDRKAIRKFFADRGKQVSSQFQNHTHMQTFLKRLRKKLTLKARR